jgi:NAD-dependent dihydropyrimidine dehydrogenase PreA subunit
MDQAKLYDDLVEHLNRDVIVGSPKSAALMEILKILFPLEEAEIAVKMPMQNKTLAELRALYPEKSEALEDILKKMIKHGTVFTSKPPGKERRYRLFPSIVGWAETPFWAGKDTPEARKLAPLWIKYREEAFGKELARNNMPVMRVVPISRSLRDSSKVLPFDVLKPIITSQSFCAVGMCPCRQTTKYNGDGCDHELERCLHFGSMGRYMVEQGMARELTHDETLQILKDANEEGLVHIIDNLEGYMSTICNCCGCCCVFMQTKKRDGLHTLSASSYAADVDRDRCVGCGTCEDRCPMDAIQVGKEEVAEVNEEICLGCGACVPSCEAEAVALIPRSEANPPPTFNEFLAKRLKTA